MQEAKNFRNHESYCNHGKRNVLHLPILSPTSAKISSERTIGVSEKWVSKSLYFPCYFSPSEKNMFIGRKFGDKLGKVAKELNAPGASESTWPVANSRKQDDR